MSDKMKNLFVRTLSGAVLAVVIFSAILYAKWSFGLLFGLLLLGGMHEFYNLVERQGNAPQRVIGMLTGLLLFAVNFCYMMGYLPDGQVWILLRMLLLLPFLMLICELFRGHETPGANIGVTLLGVFYVALPLTLACYIPTQFGLSAWRPEVMLFFILIIWANDVFAYLVGITLGRHRLFERISPKKSWEGFIGGLLGAALMGYIASRCLGGDAGRWIGLALTAAATGVLGDLAESMLKRAADVKDSGNLIPGHGGILDRFDAMLMAIPFVLVYLVFIF